MRANSELAIHPHANPALRDVDGARPMDVAILAYPRRAVEFDPRHSRLRSIIRCRQQSDHVDGRIERDADQPVLRPLGDAAHHLAPLELDGERRARLDRRISADHHAARRNVADQAQLAAAADEQCAYAQ